MELVVKISHHITVQMQGHLFSPSTVMENISHNGSAISLPSHMLIKVDFQYKFSSDVGFLKDKSCPILTVIP
jgi:hypothetical protein